VTATLGRRTAVGISSRVTWHGRLSGIEDARFLGVSDRRQRVLVARDSELIARQIGDADAVLVLKVSGRFKPSQQERDKRERIAAVQDKEATAMEAPHSIGCSASKQHEPTTVK